MPVLFERTKARNDFVKANWGTMRQKDIAAKLGCSPTLVNMIGSEMDLVKSCKSSAEVRSRYCSIENVKKVAKLFKIGQKIKLKIRFTHGAYINIGCNKYRTVRGTVAYKTEWLVVVQSENHRESFKYIDFCVGDVQII
ncbi:hypothetical protein [Clostridium ljungdahlii]|uniref:Uncharacterized protein n=1 Tax=Clostridium ljungdahlii TaxID=1538 RepID=A0A170NKJ1_9CLOT|nr:hypothetical protein [Clostridium ljungdahlii]OAA91234.1 hypothetical protein WY13_00799 [Clostridium ljungdahlii]